MKTGVGLVLVGVGAILAFAVTTSTSVFNFHVAGWVIMLVGLLGLVLPRRGYQWVGQRLSIRQTRRRGRGVEEVIYPATVNRNPAHTRVRAGLPAPSALGDPDAVGNRDAVGNPEAQPEVRPVDTEVIEDIYED